MLELMIGLAAATLFWRVLYMPRNFKKRLEKTLAYDQYRVVKAGVSASKITYNVRNGRLNLSLENPYTNDKDYHISLDKLVKEIQNSGYRLPSSTVVKSSAPVSCWFILGMMPTKDTGKVKTAYRKMSMVYHPDLGGDAKAFQSLTVAYNTALSLCKK